MAEAAQSKLWVADPENRLDFETYPVPTSEELIDAWHEYIDADADVVAARGVYGVLTIPKETPWAVASIDLCETVRHTSLALRSVEEQPPKRPEELACIHCYAEGLSVADNGQIVQTLVNEDLVQPVENIDEIALILRSWRQRGVYTFANTSTLPGCERGTIRFLGKYAAGGFDGILFPRNHDGKSALTKGVVARGVTERFENLSAVVHIDDLAHHNESFRKAFAEVPRLEVATFQPVWPSCHPLDEGSTYGKTPLEAFQRADEFLHGQLD